MTLSECVEWCQARMNEAAEAGDFASWSDYEKLKDLWQRRLDSGEIK